jgi:hypothetical protein
VPRWWLPPFIVGPICSGEVSAIEVRTPFVTNFTSSMDSEAILRSQYKSFQIAKLISPPNEPTS